MNFPRIPIGQDGSGCGRALAALMGMVTLVYLRGLWGEFVWDDRLFFIENDILTAWKPWDIASILLEPSTYWDDHIPATALLFVLQHNAFGLWTPGYHLVSLVLYIATGVLVFRLARLLYELALGGGRFVGISENSWGPGVSAFVVTAFFMLHPVHVEAVAYITGQKDLLYGLFSLLSLYMLALHSRDGGGRGRLALAAAFYYLAFMAKYMAVATGLFIPVLWFMLLRKKGQPMGRPAGYFLLLNLPALLWLAFSIQALGPVLRSISGMGGRLILGLKVLGAHLSVFLLPWPLNFGYPFNSTGAFDPNMLMGILFISLLALAVARRPRSIATLGGLTFLVFLLPALQVFVRIDNAMVFDRYLYISVLGGAVALERAAAWLAPRSRGLFVRGGLIAVAVLYALLTFSYVPSFGSDVATLRHAYTHFPGWKRPVFDYVYALIEDGQLKDARRIASTDSSLARPAWVRPYFEGWILLRENRLDEAIAYLELASYDAQAGRYKLYADLPLCRAYLAKGQRAKARAACQRVLAQRLLLPVEYFQARRILSAMDGPGR